MSSNSQPLVAKPQSANLPDESETMIVDSATAGSRWRTPRYLTKSSLVLLILLLVIVVLLVIILLGTTIYYSVSNAQCNENATHRGNEFDWDYEPAESSIKRAGRSVRLPMAVRPKHYVLKLQVDMQGNYPYNGSVEIDLNVSQSTSAIYLHSAPSLHVDKSAFKLNVLTESGSLGSVIDVTDVEYERDAEWYVIKLGSQELNPALNYRLTVTSFTATLSTDLKGWYLSGYHDGSNYKYLATSQLQPTDARRVFPCFDEPSFKAIFEVTIFRPTGYHSLSNMPMKETRQLDSYWHADIYHPTLNMSTYLLAFVVSQFESRETTDCKGRRFSVWARPEKIASAEYALTIGPKLLCFFEEYFTVPYPLNKTDMVAVPDFAAGAMENWGLIIYRELTMLWSADLHTSSARQRVLSVIAHELAHQWFGNLVTMAWWDDLWLNEGFATFAETLGVAYLHPDWISDGLYSTDNIQRAFTRDSLLTSRPIFQPVHYPHEINEIFDHITYQKGAAVLRMIETFMGRDNFRSALRHYLSTNQYQNTVNDDLWRSLSQVALESGHPVDIKTVMGTWMNQMNYPLVTVQRIDRSTSYELTQTRYLSSSNATTEKPDFEWQIPLTYGSKNTQGWDTVDIIWMKSKKATIEIDSTINSPWYLFNVNQTGYYRIHYADGNWENLKSQLLSDHTVIPPPSRAQIIDDLYNLAGIGTVELELLLNVTLYLENDNDLAPWATAVKLFSLFRRMLRLQSSYGSLKAYFRQLADKPYAKVDWTLTREEEDRISFFYRRIIVGLACMSDHDGCIKKSFQLFNRYMQTNSSDHIPISLKDIVFCTVIKHGGQFEWDFLYNQFGSIEGANDSLRMLLPLACSQNAWLIESYLDEVLVNTDYDVVELFDRLGDMPGPLFYTLLLKRVEDMGNTSLTNPKLAEFVFRALASSTMYGLPTLKQLRMRFTRNPIGRPSNAAVNASYQQMIGVSTAGQQTPAETEEEVKQNYLTNFTKRMYRDLVRRIKENDSWMIKHRRALEGWLTANVVNRNVHLFRAVA